MGARVFERKLDGRMKAVEEIFELADGGFGPNEDKEEIINEAFEEADVRKAGYDAVEEEKEYVGIWGSHAASHCCSRNLKEVLVKK